MFQTKVVEKIKTRIICSIYSPPPPENRVVCEIMCKEVQNACHCNKDYEKRVTMLHYSTLLILYYYPPYVSFLH